jgi:hypothetical protein
MQGAGVISQRLGRDDLVYLSESLGKTRDEGTAKIILR